MSAATATEPMVFVCPHCSDAIVVLRNEVNCRIFRHGVMKSDYKQVDPHAPKDVCDRLVAEGLIFGCGRPFRLVPDGNDGFTIEICDYI